MFTKHNNKPRCNHPPLESVSNARCYHSPLEGESQSQLVGDAVRGQKLIAKSNTQLNPNTFVPSPKASPSTLPQGEGDCTELDKVDNAESEANYKSKNSYSQKKLQFAKNLHHNQTDAEGLLWYYIRSKQLGSFKFKRQQIIGKYIVDFVCFEVLDFIYYQLRR